MSADGSIVIETNIDDKNAQKELNRLNRQIKSLEEQLAAKKQGRIPLENSLNSVNTKLEEARKRLATLQDEQSVINISMQPGVSADDFMRSYADKPIVDAALKQQQAEVNAIEKEWKQANNALSTYDSKVSSLERKLNRTKEEAGSIQQNMARAGPASEKMAKSVDRAQKSAAKFSMRLREVIRSALVFTIITQALAKFREWMSKVIKTNDEARASIARLKGALLTLAQPFVDVIIPAFAKFVDILAQIISMAARFTAALFGTTADKAADSAESLYEETKAIEGTGEAAEEAEKSMASFDEINQLSGGNKKVSDQDQEIIPDFSTINQNSGWLQKVMESVSAWVPIALMLGGIALIAIGASMGSLILVIAGLLLLGTGIAFAGENEQLQSWVDALGLNSVQEFVVIAVILGGIAMVAIGAATANILLVIAGLVLIGVAVAYAAQSGMMQDWAETLGLSRAAQFITAALLIAGFALVCIGAGLGNILMVISGIALFATGIYVGIESSTLKSWAETLGLDSAFEYVAAAIQIAGFALICIGAAMGNIFMVVAGGVLLAAGITAELIGEQTLMAWWEKLKLTTVVQWISVVILLAGIVMIAVAAATANIPLLIAGAIILGLGIVASVNDGHLQDWVETLGLEKVMGYVTAAVMLVGIGLVAIGLMTMNLTMFLGGIALLVAGLVIGNESGTFQSWVETLHLEEVAGWVSTALLLAGIALVAIGAMTLNPVMLLAGIALLGGGAVLKLGSSGATNGMPSGGRMSRMAPPRLAIEDVPALARGAVIPPNKEFLAVLGDQKSGTNIEAPTSEIEAAVMRGIQRSGMSGGSGDHTVILQIGEREMGRVMYRLNNQQTQRIGVRLSEE
nr:MAG TPA: chromosome segregation protein [Caudoviricetes sp.]